MNDKHINNFMPVFPVNRDYEEFNPGMALRDYFAAKAMQSMLLALDQSSGYGLKDVPLDIIHDTIASWSYLMADAMIKARDIRND